MAAKQVLILLGSPRKTGNSAVLAQQLAEGAEKSGADVRTLYLHGMDISPCTGCNHCQGAHAQGCVVDDDMQGIYGQFREADSIVFASPIYWFSVTAQIKMVIDRIYAVGGGEKNVFRGKEFGILLTYADSDPFTSGAVNALRMFQDISAYLGVRIAGTVYGSAYEAGEIKDSKEVMKAAFELGMKLGEEPKV
ncbi:MAG TPA: flavodoxin family protein [Proteobacteria bacterium]|nr:putative NAD(P)H-dependent FMN-containing oxidoreductase YwqN [bacterium BMS3Abin14]HDL53122.1 flavodoxin family protein [Pseudomonadota bacterium]